jgi:hypothetical protein
LAYGKPGVRHHCRMRRIIVPLCLGSALLVTTPAAATTHAPELPAVGDHFYDLTGHSTLGSLPARLRLGVAAAGSGNQRWSLDASNPDGSGLVEELTVNRRSDGIHLSRYHLHVSNGFAAVDVNLTPSGSPLFIPDRVSADRTWSFDLLSDDGCVLAHTIGSSPSRATGARHLRLATTARSTGKTGCMQLEAKRTQDLWVPTDSSLPTRIDCDLTGSAEGATAAVSYRATSRRS